jgi:hypothetical protein
MSGEIAEAMRDIGLQITDTGSFGGIFNVEEFADALDEALSVAGYRIMPKEDQT